MRFSLSAIGLPTRMLPIELNRALYRVWGHKCLRYCQQRTRVTTAFFRKRRQRYNGLISLHQRVFLTLVRCVRGRCDVREIIANPDADYIKIIKWSRRTFKNQTRPFMMCTTFCWCSVRAFAFVYRSRLNTLPRQTTRKPDRL